MREPVKRLELYETMKRDIAGGCFLPGEFLPNELDLAKKYGYARNTVRSTLTMLEDDKLVELLKGKGRRICPVNVKKARPPLTFLLPCADFISETYSSVAAQSSRRILKGVSQIAFEYDYRVETVPVSPTNNEHDIDWRKLDFVNADSLVVVTNYWYRDLFPLLQERGCRVAFINSQIFLSKQYQEFLKSCVCLTSNVIGATEAAVEHLVMRGCRRIALLHHYIFQQDHPVLGGYLAGLKKYNLAFSIWDELQKEHLTLEIVRNQIKDLYKRSGGFDGMIIDSSTIYELRLHNIYQELGLPENVKLIASNDIENNQRVNPRITSMFIPYEEMGRIAAQKLIADEFTPGDQLINAKLIERESTLTLKSDFSVV
jgi:DNA-binding LacI/PurR family transcriptional regulator